MQLLSSNSKTLEAGQPLPLQLISYHFSISSRRDAIHKLGKKMFYSLIIIIIYMH